MMFLFFSSPKAFPERLGTSFGTYRMLLTMDVIDATNHNSFVFIRTHELKFHPY
jgi:hypothetical protein